MTNVLKSPYPEAVAPPYITTGLIWGLAFSEGTGQSLDDLGPSNFDAQRGSTSGADANDPDWVTAGLSFVASSSDIVQTPAGVSDTGWLGALTVMVVANIASGSAYRDFVTKSNASSSAMPVEFLTTNAATPLLFLNRGSASGFRQFTGPAVTLGAYRCYTLVCGSGTVTDLPTFYVTTTATTGTLSGGGGTGAVTGTNAPIRMGRRHDGISQMNGVISYVLVYSRALSAGEIATNYAALQTIMAARGVTLP